MHGLSRRVKGQEISEGNCGVFNSPKKTQSKYPVLHQRAFDGTGYLFLGRLGSRASTEKKKFGPIMSNF